MQKQDEIMVSICCITYNQEKYIKDAIESFIAQKVKYSFEIIIHDDASTDKTQQILKEYKEKYPDKIKLILQRENQYKKGIKNSFTTFKAAKGKYIAFCEGDDYWIDENKIQKQVDYMETHPDCTLCFHNANIRYMKQNKIKPYLTHNSKYKKFFNKEGIYDVGNIHLLGFGSVPTGSFLFRTKYVERIPKFYFEAVCGDMPLKLIMTSFGYAYYMKDIMSVYRRETGISITDKWKKETKNTEKSIQHEKKILSILEDVDKFTEEKYKSEIKIEKAMYEVEILALQEKYKEIWNDSIYLNMYKLKNNDLLLIKLFIKTHLNKIYKIIKRNNKE